MAIPQVGFRKKWRGVDPCEVDAQLAALTAELRSADEERRRLQLELNRLGTATHNGGNIDQVGQEVATVLRTFAQTVGSAREEAEARASQILADAQTQADELRQSAERHAEQVRAAARQTQEHATQALDAARDEAREVLDAARAEAESTTSAARAAADATLAEARDEADATIEQARELADAVGVEADNRAARVVSDAHTAAGDIRQLAEADAAEARADADKLRAEATEALDSARREARRLLDEARLRADAAAADAEQRAAERVELVLGRAREELRRIQQARTGALHTLAAAEERLRELMRGLRSLGELEVDLLAVDALESRLPSPPAGAPDLSWVTQLSSRSDPAVPNSSSSEGARSGARSGSVDPVGSDDETADVGGSSQFGSAAADDAPTEREGLGVFARDDGVTGAPSPSDHHDTTDAGDTSQSADDSG